MAAEPSPQLLDLLTSLRLATAERVQAAAPQARKLAGGLGEFDSVWVDALAQDRVLTAFQAAEINAGRGLALAYGPYVISHPLAAPHYCECYAARHIETARFVRLYLARRCQVPLTTAARGCAQLVEQLQGVRASSRGIIADSGLVSAGLWAVCPAVAGTSAREWLVENGRFAPQIVLHIAREMLAHLVELERVGVPHGDIGAAGLLLDAAGRVTLPAAGLRGIVRPHEGYGFDDLQPEAYDYLAPERISAAASPTIASDVYACGSLWWHLLAGRPPFRGGNSLAKLRAVHAGKVGDVRRWAPEATEILSRAIELCLSRDPQARPRSLTELATLLGPATRSGAAAIGHAVQSRRPFWQMASPSATMRRGGGRKTRLVATAVGCLSVLALGTWPLWRFAATSPPTLSEARPSIDPAVKLIGASRPPHDRAPRQSQQPAGDIQLTTATSKAPEPADDLLLAAGQTTHAATLRLRAGQRVRAPAGQRTVLVVPSSGWRIASENLRFEGIDFRPDSAAAADESGELPSAMIVLEAESIEFQGCSFCVPREESPRAVLRAPSKDPHAAPAIAFTDCAFRGTVAIVDRSDADNLHVELKNSLCLDAGPLLLLRQPPGPDDSVELIADHVTTRGDTTIVECRFGRLGARHGTILVKAIDSALSTDRGGGLLVLVGRQHPDALLPLLVWSGQGSLVDTQTAMLLWRGGPKKQERLSEDALEVAGLVRSAIEFSGHLDGSPAESRVTRWQGPLSSDDPPGADTDRLFLPQ